MTSKSRHNDIAQHGRDLFQQKDYEGALKLFDTVSLFGSSLHSSLKDTLAGIIKRGEFSTVGFRTFKCS
jgi:hypothetical protein